MGEEKVTLPGTDSYLYPQPVWRLRQEALQFKELFLDYKTNSRSKLTF